MIRYFLIFIFLFFSLKAEYREIEDLSNLSLLHPSLKEQRSEKLQLENGLSVLLISDPQTDQSAASIAIGIGSWNDPKQYPGTAHFLEHMLFYKNNTYPKTQEIFEVVANNGGKLNAFTMPDRTVYSFSVNNGAFLETLDRFAHFFIDPIITDQDMQKEVKAVDQEFQKNWENDGWRRYFIQKETGNPDHPNARFSTGNLDSLQSLTAQTLNSWFNKFYGSQRTYLVIYSSLPLDRLREEVDQIFSQVPESEFSLSPIDEQLSSEEQEGKMIFIEPVANWKRLTLAWELPKEFAVDESKSLVIIKELLEKSDPTSLLSLLKEEGLAEDLRADVETIAEEYALFDLEIILTTKGVQRKNRVIELCHAALNYLKQNKIPYFLYQEIYNQKKLTYEYQDRDDAFSYAEKLATLMVEEDLSSFPKKILLPTHFDPEKIVKALSFLSPSRCQYYLMAPSSLTNVKYDKEEHWYKTKYTVSSIKPALFSSWEEAEDSRIGLPKANPFLPESFAVTEVENSSMVPELIAENNYGKGYYFYEKEFAAPFISHKIHIKSPLISPDPRSYLLTFLYIKQLEDRSRYLIGKAEEAGLTLSVDLQDLALTLEIQGFSDKASIFIEEISKKLHLEAPSRESYQQMKEFFVTYFSSKEKAPPYIQGLNLASSIFRKNRFTPDLLLSTLGSITYEEYADFIDQLFHSSYIEALLSGNLTKKEAQSLWLDIQHLLRSKPFPSKEHYLLPNPLLKEHPSYLTKKLDQKGNLSLLFLDVGFFSYERKACTSLVSRILKESFFNELRTKQQTGYIAKAGEMEINKELFHFFFVQSTTHQPMDLLFRFELFLEDFIHHIEEKIPQERFETIRENLIISLKNRNKSLDDRADYFDMAAFTWDGEFDYIEKSIQALENLTYEQLIAYCIENLSKDNGRRFAILLDGVKEKEPFVYRPVTKEELSAIFQ